MNQLLMKSCAKRAGLLAVSLLVLAASANPAKAVIIIPQPLDSTTAHPVNLIVVSSLNIPNDGGPLGSRVYFSTLPLSGNDLAITANNESTALSNLANITDMVRSGYDGGDWLGTGINSISAQNDFSQGYRNMAVGVILNDDGSHVHPDGSGNPIWSTFDGTSFNQYAVLVKYTFYGDLNLKGSVAAADVNKVAHAVGTGLGWAQGVFSYSGLPATHADLVAANYSLYLQQDYPLSTPAGPRPDVPPPPSVPEPSSFLLVAIGLMGVCCRLRRR